MSTVLTHVANGCCIIDFISDTENTRRTVVLYPGRPDKLYESYKQKDGMILTIPKTYNTNDHLYYMLKYFPHIRP